MFAPPIHRKLLPFTLALPLATAGCGSDESPTLDDEVTEASTGSQELLDASSTGDEPSGSSEGAGTSDDEVPPSCGNGIVELGETCDDGEHNGEPERCASDCQGPAPWCGDAEIQAGEACDDGNDVDADGCNTDCRASGTVVWEHRFEQEGWARAVDVGPDGAVYAAGQAQASLSAAWAARLDAQDGSVEWTSFAPTFPGSTYDNLFHAVHVIDEHMVAFAGRHNDRAYVRLLHPTGDVIEGLFDDSRTYLNDVVAVPGGYLAKVGNEAIRYDDTLTPLWTTTVGPDLAHVPGDDIALAVSGVGFRRFALTGIVHARTEFPLPAGVFASTGLVTWTNGGNVVVAGNVSGDGATEALVLQSSADGELDWMYGPAELQGQYRQVHCLAVDSQDSIVVGGHTQLLGEVRPFIMKLSSEGSMLWVRHLEFEATNAVAWDCTTTDDDEIVAVGQADGHIWAAKLTP